MYNGFYANYKKKFRSIWLHGQLLIEPLLTPVDELLSKEHSDEVKTLVYIYVCMYVCVCVAILHSGYKGMSSREASV